MLTKLEDYNNINSFRLANKLKFQTKTHITFPETIIVLKKDRSKVQETCTEHWMVIIKLGLKWIVNGYCRKKKSHKLGHLTKRFSRNIQIKFEKSVETLIRRGSCDPRKSLKNRLCLVFSSRCFEKKGKTSYEFLYYEYMIPVRRSNQSWI